MQQGVGWITELLSRFTGQLVPDATQTNHTLHRSESTFPLRNTKIYMDFSHDNQIIAVLSALGLVDERMDPTHSDATRQWRTANLVPFSGRLTAELLNCRGDKEKHVRILINDRPQNLPKPCHLKSKLCSLSNFVASQHFAIHEGQTLWPRCGHIPNN